MSHPKSDPFFKLPALSTGSSVSEIYVAPEFKSPSSPSSSFGACNSRGIPISVATVGRAVTHASASDIRRYRSRGNSSPNDVYSKCFHVVVVIIGAASCTAASDATDYRHIVRAGRIPRTVVGGRWGLILFIREVR